MTLLTNPCEGSSGTTISAGNSAGAGWSAFDTVSAGTGATVAYDSAHAAHGATSAKIATGGTAALASLNWTTAAGAMPTAWFGMYLFFTANPAATWRVWNATLTGTGSCGSLSVITTGKLRFSTGTAGTTTLTTTASIPLNTWFRVEGFLTGDAVAGQVEIRLFSSPDATAPDETQTSAANINTTGVPNSYGYGSSNSLASVGPYWVDRATLSSAGYTGPEGYKSPVLVSPCTGFF